MFDRNCIDDRDLSLNVINLTDENEINFSLPKDEVIKRLQVKYPKLDAKQLDRFYEFQDEINYIMADGSDLSTRDARRVEFLERQISRFKGFDSNYTGD